MMTAELQLIDWSSFPDHLTSTDSVHLELGKRELTMSSLTASAVNQANEAH
jgi:hypothetical protein